MSKDDKLEVEGKVVKSLKGTKFEVELENGHTIMCDISGKLRLNQIRVLVGDSVTVSISPYDLNRGIITWRNK